MKLRIAQLVVSKDVSASRARILGVIADSEPGEWVVFPEAVLSGYYPYEDVYTSGLDWDFLVECLNAVQAKATEKRVHVLLGSAVREGSEWHNSVQIFDAEGGCSHHHKIELSGLDRIHFSPGSGVSVHQSSGLTFGVLACRELLFPAHWSKLRAEGAKVIFHINNALHPKDEIWKHLLIARAIENAAYVVSVNNADHPQALASYVIDPGGVILEESIVQIEQILTRTIDLDAVVDDLADREDF